MPIRRVVVALLLLAPTLTAGAADKTLLEAVAAQLAARMSVRSR